ncbi:EamA family transporter [Candidatus Woesearchaeota archaeon]|nr:EamA family transporter [Candidatus Woesearchaeota archaeon]
MNWLIYGILAMIAYALFNFFVKLSSNKINVPLAVGIISLTAAIVGFIIFGYLKITNQNIIYSTDGLKFVILAGIFVSLAELFYYFMFMEKVNLSIGLPLVVGGTIAIGSILGVIFLSESLTAYQIFGIIFTLMGIILLSI